MIETDTGFIYSSEEIERFRKRVPRGAIFCLEATFVTMEPENEAERLFLAKRAPVRILVPCAWYIIPNAEFLEAGARS